MPERPVQILLTCEHGGNVIPRGYRWAFQDADQALTSHRGHDAGALELAKKISRFCHVPLEHETRSRLLIELNRTLGHPRIFSEFSRRLSAEDQQTLIDQIYAPYRTRVICQISNLMKRGPVLHLSIHSFTPVMNEKTRRTDIGILFDPSRHFESAVARQWKKSLQRSLPEYSIHFNLPYRGTSDGFTTALRQQFPDTSYAGIELEVNQKFVAAGDENWKNLKQALVSSVRQLQIADRECLTNDRTKS